MTQEQLALDLCAEFPRWAVSDSGIHRRWAMRKDRPTTAQIKAGCKLFLDGSSDAQLRERLRAEEERLAGVAG